MQVAGIGLRTASDAADKQRGADAERPSGGNHDGRPQPIGQSAGQSDAQPLTGNEAGLDQAKGLTSLLDWMSCFVPSIWP